MDFHFSVGKKDLIGFVISSLPRFNTLIILKETALRPSEISKRINQTIYRTSTILGELSDKDLIKCINPRAKKGRLYTLTEKGRGILQEINKLTDQKQRSEDIAR
ncbi:MAG: hypothetical protein FJ149_11870 [Euryarchaeota archaeon]|nr:hypothetical protein [Euryarchaeota archaeon]